jgi:DNA polymerase elongation subunit (family B)|tara:strand:+ start:9489 stop:11978 length:2490 start_codon:yes stop_codon:yes gene_type:complete
MNFYKNVTEHKGKLLVRGVRDNKEFKEKINFCPTLYSVSQQQEKFKNLQGQYLKPITFNSIDGARRFKRDVATRNSPIYGLERYHYQWISENYKNQIKWSKDLIKIFTLDIECSCENGFPDVDNPVEELLCITVKNQSNKQIITWGVGDFNTDRKDVTYIKCKSEQHLIMEFMKFWLKNYPDVITGWNTKFFDLPYLMNRIKMVAGEKVASRMSPWNLVQVEQIVVRGRPNTYYSLLGIAMLDYLDLYKWYIPTRQESYRLGFIGEVELGQTKTENPYSTFKDFYTKDFQKFVEYNIQDVEIVDALEDKLGLIDLSLTFAYETKVNYNDIFSQVRVWDTLIANYLMTKKICVPPRVEHIKDTKYEGAYVKEPRIGMQKWVVSFDINSLYPHIIVQYNISPEKILGLNSSGISVNKMLSKKTPLDYLKTEGATITPNGAMFKTDSQGFLPEMIQKIYNERVVFKKRMLKAKKEYQKTKEPSLVKEIARCHNIQWARKIALNSCYGAIGNQYFRYYDVRQASAVTTAGQFIIRFIEEKVNEYLNQVLQTKGEIDYIIASDTDSIYVSLDKLVEKTCKDKTDDQIADFIGRVCDSRLEPYIEKQFTELADYTNAFKNAMVMKREVIANKGIWVAKKRYMLNVIDEEGIRLAEPKLKLMGIEAVKSSTPQVCRGKIKEAIKIIMSKQESDLHKFIADFKKEFMSLDPEAISFPRSCNNMRKYGSSKDVFIKGSPIHVKGALIYNHQIKEFKLQHKYPYIQEGDKIKFIKLLEANPFKFDVISYITTLPKEFNLNEYVDYELQFEKTFLDPMRFILNSIGWEHEKKASLEAFFG